MCLNAFTLVSYGESELVSHGDSERLDGSATRQRNWCGGRAGALRLRVRPCLYGAIHLAPCCLATHMATAARPPPHWRRRRALAAALLWLSLSVGWCAARLVPLGVSSGWSCVPRGVPPQYRKQLLRVLSIHVIGHPIVHPRDETKKMIPNTSGWAYLYTIGIIITIRFLKIILKFTFLWITMRKKFVT